MAKKWPLQGMEVPRPGDNEFGPMRVTTEQTLSRDLELSAHDRGLVYCDSCGMWFQSSCMCDDFRREDY